MAMVTSRREVLAGATSLALTIRPQIGLAEATSRRNLTIAVQELRPVLEPADPASIAAVAWRIQHSIFEQPLRTDYLDGFQLRPSLAERVEQLDDTRYRLTLRRGVKFHDGREMTADDVVLSLGPERLLGKEAPGHLTQTSLLPTLAAVEKIDDMTALLSLSRTDPVFMKRLGGWGAQIISSDAWRKAGSYKEWSKAPVGTGPYRIAEVRFDDQIVLRAHDEYWAGRPPYASLRFKLVRELAARVAGLLAGEYDIITDVAPDQMAEIEARSDLAVVSADPVILRVVEFDVRNNPLLADVNLRRAMSLAIDRKALVDSLWGGRVTIPNGNQLPIYGALYDASRPAPSYDPVKARELLARSTYRGETIPFATVGNYYTLELAETQALVEMWNAVGLNVAIQIRENWSQVYEVHGLGNDSVGLFYADPVSTLWRVWGEGGWIQASRKTWSNDEFNRLGRILGSSSDPDARKRAFQRMLDIFEWDDPPAMMLHTHAYIYGKRTDLDWRPNPIPQMDFGPSRMT